MSILYYFLYYGNQTLINLRVYTWVKKTWTEISSQCQDCIIAILKKRVLKQTIREGQEKSKILSIPNKYKNTLEDLVNSLDVEHLTILRQIDLPNNNIPTCKDNSSDSKIDNDFSDRL